MKHFSIQQKFFILSLLFTIVGMLFFLSRELYKSYRLDQQISTYHQKNQQIQEQIETEKEKILYFASPRYQDKYAKEVLNKLNPGEKVFIITEKQENVLIPQSEILDKTPIKYTPLEAWQKYFFDEDDLENRGFSS